MQLFLSLHGDRELVDKGLFARLRYRLGVATLKKQGKDWEQAKYSDLEHAFGVLLDGKDNAKGRAQVGSSTRPGVASARTAVKAAAASRWPPLRCG